MNRKLSLRLLAGLLVLSLLVTLSNQGLLAYSSNVVNVMASSETGDGGLDNYIICNGTLDYGTDDDGQTPQEEPQQENSDKADESDEAVVSKLCGDGMIHVFNYRQLLLTGTGVSLTDGDAKEETVGTGRVITDENGDAVTYAKDAKYFLEGDIALPKDAAWVLPDDFTGEFTSEEETARQKDESEDESPEGDQPPETDARSERLYDAETDTVYIQNVYQLLTLASENRGKTPVMTGDTDMETFGTGELIYPEGETGWYLTYSAEHNYVISSAFTAGIPEEVSPAVSMPLRATADANLKVAGEGNRDGRDGAGQVTVTIGDKDYILIGNYQQLEALNYGSDSVEVYGPIYAVSQKYNARTVKYETTGVELYYPGDADLTADQKIFDGNNGSDGAYHKLGLDQVGTTNRIIYCAVDPETGSYMKDDEENLISSYVTDNPISAKYSRTGNYIVFRDINMSASARPSSSHSSWTPLMFSGTMCGVKLQDNNSTGKLWNEAHDSLNDTEEGTRPIISNVKVAPDTKGGKLNVSVQMGVGFFGTISGYMDYTGFVTRNTKVRNICISGATVENPCTECEVDQTLVSGLLSTVGSALGLVLDGVLSLLLDGTINGEDVRSPLTAMLNARAADPTSLATGAFVGRIDGDVTIEKCKVVNCTVKTKQTEFEKSSNGKEGKIVGVGGFVGSSQGEFEYGNLSDSLGNVSKVLADVLNVIPGLGLGDLITILLGNAVPLGLLMPVGYHQPTITDCDVVNNTFQLYSNEGRMGYGGFAGSLCGTMADSCQVQSSTLTIKAENFGGGFAGVVRDDIIVQTLSGLNITVGSWYPQSIVMNSSVNNSTINISGKDCLGGFIGIQANSIVMVDAIDADSSLNITTTGDCIGGFTGKAQLGSLTYVTDYLKDDNSVTDVLQGVVSALAGFDSKELLDMGVVSRSGIYGVEVNCPVSLITTGDKVGGLVGSGEGVYISRSSKANIKAMTKYDDDDAVVPTVTDRINKVERIVNVKGKDFAGGAAGCLKSANISSLLNNTLGLKNLSQN